VFQTTGNTKILEGKLREKIFYSPSDQRLQEGEGHTVSSTENKEILSYGPENTVYSTRN